MYCPWVQDPSENVRSPKALLQQKLPEVATGRERLIRSHSSARFCFELSGNSN